MFSQRAVGPARYGGRAIPAALRSHEEDMSFARNVAEFQLDRAGTMPSVFAARAGHGVSATYPWTILKILSASVSSTRPTTRVALRTRG
jgi:hypothetical protein